MNLEFQRKKAVWYLCQFIGRAYLWGGDDPLAGFDCSGLVMEVLKAVGLETPGADKTADMLWLKYAHNEIPLFSGGPGCLVFWFNSAGPETKAIHVEMMIDEAHAIGASGGGSSTTTLSEAVRRNAFVKMRLATYRGVGYKIADPFLEQAP